MKNDSIFVLGGLALILFLSTSGARTVARIERNVQTIDDLFQIWAEKNRQDPITRMMEDFLYKSQDLLRLDGDILKKMTKAELMQIVTKMTKGPLDVLVNLSKTIKSSFIKDKDIAEEFCDRSASTLSLLLRLFEGVFGIFPGESKTTAKIITRDLHAKLHQVITFSF